MLSAKARVNDASAVKKCGTGRSEVAKYVAFEMQSSPPT
jgi:hypothetical protein